MKEFFGFGGYMREPEGFLSWQHIVFVTLVLTVMTILAIVLGGKNKHADSKTKNKVLIGAAILIDSFELFKIVLLCFRSEDPMNWLYNLPLFLCSIQLIAIPIAAFAKGRLKEASLDFVLIFGILGAILGTYGAGQNYGCYPVISFDNVVSAITHAISGFASLYILFSGMFSMKKKNIPVVFSILVGFCVAAFVANKLIDYNYMFLVRGDGTPYDVFYNLVNGNQVLYPMIVILLFFIYISLFYLFFFLIHETQKNFKEAKARAQHHTKG